MNCSSAIYKPPTLANDYWEIGMNFNAIQCLLKNYKISKSMVAGAVTLLALTLGLSVTASADIFQDLTFTRAITNCNFRHPPLRRECRSQWQSSQR